MSTHMVVRHGANGSSSVVFSGTASECREYMGGYAANYQNPGYLSIEKKQ